MRKHWRRIASLVVALVLVVPLLGLSAPANKVEGYTHLGFLWREGTPQQISYCITGAWGESRKNLIRTAVEKWNNQANINVYEDCGAFGAFFDIEITMVPQDSVAQGGCRGDKLVYGNFYSYDGTYFNKRCSGKGGFVWLNPEYNDNPRMWWGQGAQDCNMGPGSCLHDAKTVFTHEMGHALGMGHQQNSEWDDNKSYSENMEQACNRGPVPGAYWTNIEANIDDACPPSGRKIMSAYAGGEGYWWGSVGGFRHSFASHDTNGIRALYGP